MKVLEMSDQEIWDILKVTMTIDHDDHNCHSDSLSVLCHKVLAALLHMGNIKYKSTSEKNMEASNIPDLTNVERVAAILGLTKNALLQVSSSQSLLFSSSSTCLQSSLSYVSRQVWYITYPKTFEVNLKWSFFRL